MKGELKEGGKKVTRIRSKKWTKMEGEKMMKTRSERKQGIDIVDHLVNPEFNDARSREEMNCKAGVRCEDCCVVAQNCKLRVAHPRHLIGSFDFNIVRLSDYQ